MKLLPAIWYDSLPSTNLWMRESLVAGGALAPGTVVAAKRQTAGRGRKARSWETGEGNLACSAYLVSRRPAVEVPSLSLVCALAVRLTLEDFGLRPLVKWPNDVLVGNRKISGILLEVVRMAPGESHVIVGIGINVNMTEEACASIGRPATSMRLETGTSFEPAELLDRLRGRLGGLADTWEDGGFVVLREEWCRRAYGFGGTVHVTDEEGRRSGIFTDVGEHGELHLLTGETTTSVRLGEID